MNDLFSRSFSADRHVIEMTEPPLSNNGANLDRFFEEVDSIKLELQQLHKLNGSLQSAHEQTKTQHNVKNIKDLRSKMESDVAQALKKAKGIKVRLDGLDRSNVASRSLPGCGPGSSSERTRTAVVGGLRKELRDCMESFNRLREKISSEYRETVQRMCFTVTGENPDDATLDRLISTGESETFMQRAIQEQGRGRIMETINEIQERHDAVKEMEKNLKELHQVFLDMAVLVQVQGQELDDIESNMQRANSYVRGGAQQLQKARILQKNSRKWCCCASVLLLLIILIIVLFTIRPWE